MNNTITLTLECTISEDVSVFSIDQQPVVMAHMASATLLGKTVGPDAGWFDDEWFDKAIPSIRLAIPVEIYRRRLANRSVSDCVDVHVTGVLRDIPNMPLDCEDIGVVDSDCDTRTILFVTRLGWTAGTEIKFPTVQELIDEGQELSQQFMGIAAMFPEPPRSTPSVSGTHPWAVPPPPDRRIGLDAESECR